MAETTGSPDTFASLHRRLLAVNLNSDAFVSSSDPNADREPWGKEKHREVSGIVRRVIALLEQQDRLQAMPYMEMLENLRRHNLGRTDSKFRVTKEVAAACTSKHQLVERYRGYRSDLAMMIERITPAFPQAVLKSTAPKTPHAPKRPWMEVGLPASLENFALTLEKHGGEATASQLKQGIHLAPADVLAKCKPQWAEWIEKHIKRPRRGVYKLE